MEKIAFHKVRINREILGSKFNYLVIFGVDFILLIAVDKHHKTSINQEKPKYVKDPAKFTDQGSANKNKQKTKDNSTDNPPNQNFVVVLRVDPKRAEYKHHDKDI